MGTNGLEPSTSRLSGVRSNHLSYAPNIFSPLSWEVFLFITHLLFDSVLGPASRWWWRIRESNPWPPACKAGALPAELIPRFSCLLLQNWTVIGNSTCDTDCRVQSIVFLRKEVIQPHLPIRLPCYDLTLIIDPTFDCAILAVKLQASGVANSHGLTGGVYKARERIHRGMLIHDY